MANSEDFDYSALRRSRINPAIIIFGILFLLVVVVVDFFTEAQLIVGVVYLAVVAAIWRYAFINLLNPSDSAADTKKMKKFAESNGFEFTDEVYDPNFMPHDLRDLLVSDLSYVVSGENEGNRLRMFTYRFGKDGLNAYRVLQFEVEGYLPHFIVNATTNLANAPKTIQYSDYVRLEGNFSDNFGLYIPKKTQVDVLSVMSPDLMELIEPYWADLDIVVADNRVWFFAKGPLRDTVPVLLDAYMDIYPKLNHKSKTFRLTK